MLAPRAEDRAIDTTTDPLRPVTLVLGGAASGKSLFAETLIESGFDKHWQGATYLATATAEDAEMAAKIERHRERRGPHWTTVEEPLALPDVLAEHAQTGRPILVDCLTLWLTNLILADHVYETAAKTLAESLPALPGPVVFVSNEVGGGIVPENALARQFRNAAGRLNQTIAAAANRVYLVTAGLPQTLKDI